MSATELLLKFMAAGSLVTVITLLARTKYTALSGVLMLFPAVTLIGLYFIGTTVDVTTLKQITRFGMYALSTTFIFLVAFYYAQDYMSVPKSLGLSTLAWVFSASGLVGVTRL